MPTWLLILSTCVCAGTLAMTVVNLFFYRRRPPADRSRGASDAQATVSVCIPARNEEGNLAECVGSVLASTGVELDVLVYDDQSTDATAAILARLASADARVRRVPTDPLPVGWVGKQWACSRLGGAATGEWVLFLDADVRLAPACLGLALRHAGALRADLISTFPRQLTGSFGEALVVPLIHFILLSYLPFARMRSSNDPSAAAACGQFILARREAYLAAGGHGAVRASMHDGVKLPRVFRRAGFHTDLFDAGDLARCRMYRGFGATWRGFVKNAYEGLGSPALLGLLTALHVVGYLVPWAALVMLALGVGEPATVVPLAASAVALALAHRLLLAARFGQSILSALLHPLGIVLVTAIQWHSFALHLFGRRSWRGRTLTGGIAAGAPPSRPVGIDPVSPA